MKTPESMDIFPGECTAPRGFTLIELLVTVAIIGLLASLLVPAVNRSIHTGRSAACLSNMRTIGSTLSILIVDEDGRLPGRGSLYSNGAGASWQDVLNKWAFDNGSRTTAPLQVLGDRPEPRKMYCPAMKPWGTATRYPRAYVMNAYLVPAVKNNPQAEPQKPEYNGIYKYDPGLRISKIPRPSQTIYLMESERNGDYVEPSTPYGQLTLGNGSNAPRWATSNLNWAFRHNNRGNFLYVDGHVESLDLEAAKTLNNLASFDPDQQ